MFGTTNKHVSISLFGNLNKPNTRNIPSMEKTGSLDFVQNALYCLAVLGSAVVGTEGWKRKRFRF